MVKEDKGVFRKAVSDDRDALRALNAREFSSKPRVPVDEGFKSSRGYEREIDLILETAKKFKPYEKKE
jgi:hypothetical protein